MAHTITETSPVVDFIRARRASIYSALCQAGRPVNEVVVILADLGDPAGQVLGEKARVAMGIGLVEEQNCAIIIRPLAHAEVLLSVDHAAIARAIHRETLPGHVRVVVVTTGAVALVHFDIRPTSPIACA